MTTKTANLSAWLPTSARIKAAHAADQDSDELINEAGFSSLDMTSHGWVRIGEATICIDLIPTDDLITAHIAALRKEQGDLVAKANRVEQQIQSLLALPSGAKA